MFLNKIWFHRVTDGVDIVMIVVFTASFFKRQLKRPDQSSFENVDLKLRKKKLPVDKQTKAKEMPHQLLNKRHQ